MKSEETMRDAEADRPGPARRDRGGARPRRARRGYRVALGLIAVLAVADGAVYLALSYRASQSTDTARVEGNEIVVSSQIVGRVSVLAKEERAAVAKGELLAALDDGPFRTQEREALAGKELADQNVALARAGLEAAEGDLRKAAARLEAEVISRREYEAAASAKVSAEAQLKIAQALSGIAEAQAVSARASLERASITSPIDGVVARMWTAVGCVVQPAQAIYTLYDLGRLWIDADFRKDQLRRIAVGDRAEIWIDAFPGKTFSGRVESVGIASASQSALLPPDNATGSFTLIARRGPVTISIDRTGPGKAGSVAAILPGMAAKVRIRTGR
jgi:membrane fusion protein, multidrug efflux system